MLPVKFLWGSVLLRGELQKYAKNSNFENFDNVHVWKLLYVIFYFPDSRRSSNNCQTWSLIAYFPDFMVRYRLTSMNGVYKTNIGCSLDQGMVENFCPLGTGLGESVGQ